MHWHRCTGSTYQENVKFRHTNKYLETRAHACNKDMQLMKTHMSTHGGKMIRTQHIRYSCRFINFPS
ncbi:hypothetical protein CICLE_v10023229mg [Citrus x clementina]|uniref:Uncharacterized protein n=1 Tax=Citrus clementina TaxID=85681 RepID=V4U4Y5_CITCL|nr:hypothetical protein CICLE_v10023229mg [Citrus x clementina]